MIFEKSTVEMTKTHSMSNLQGDSHQQFINEKYLKHYFLPYGRCWTSPKRIRPTLQPLMLGKWLYFMF